MDANHEGIFHNAHESVVFALNYCEQQSAMSPMAKLLQQGCSGSGRGLVGLDGAGQAGMVMAEIDALSRQSYFMAVALLARCSQDRIRCKCGQPCCSRSKPNPLWREAINQLGDFVLSHLAGSISNRVLRIAAIEKHFGRKVSIEQIAEDCGVHRNTAGQQVNAIRKCLKDLEANAWSAYTTALEEKGMLIREDEVQSA
jgi:hypothetical protein